MQGREPTGKVQSSMSYSGTCWSYRGEGAMRCALEKGGPPGGDGQREAGSQRMMKRKSWFEWGITGM